MLKSSGWITWIILGRPRQIGALYHLYAIEARGNRCPITAENWPVGGLNVNKADPADPLDFARA